MAEWYVQQEEADLGPLRPAELLTLVRNGTVRSETMLRKDNSAWFPAAEVGGLFEAARRPTIEHYCPTCGTRVGQPPTHCPQCIKDLDKVRTKIIEHSVDQRAKPKAETPQGPSDSARRWLHRRLRKPRND